METIFNKLKELNIFNENFHDFNECEKIQISIDLCEKLICVNYFNNGEISEIRAINF